MKILNYYVHAGVEKHCDGSFTIFGTIESCVDITYKIRYYDYSFKEALKNFKQDLKKQAINESQFVAQ
jgi:hypothetical protein